MNFIGDTTTYNLHYLGITDKNQLPRILQRVPANN
jgi:hypothetical protein